MYLMNDGQTGYRGSEQCRTRGLFLMMIQPNSAWVGEGEDRQFVSGANSPIKVAVRKVALRQCGHWMMGRANIGGKWFGVSGGYGGDGLPMDVPQETYDKLAVTLPDELRSLWNKGEGWNGPGNEAGAIRKWALANLAALRK